MSEIRSGFTPAVPGTMSRTEAFEKYGKAAAQAARTADYRRAGQQALADLMSVNYQGTNNAPAGSAGRPTLQPPPPRADGNRQETDGDLFTLLMALLSELISEVDVNKLNNRLAMLQSMAGAKQQGHEKLSAEYAAAVEALEAAEGDIGSSQEYLDQLQARVLHVQGLLDACEARLAQLDPQSPEYARELALRDQLKGELAGHTSALQTATDAHLTLIETANACARTLAAVVAKVRETGVGGSVIKDSDEKALSSSALALLNRLKIIEMLGEAAQNKEELSQALFLELQAKIQEHMKAESEKYLEEVRKAEALQKTMGCIGAIVGAILTIATITAGVLIANPVLVAVGVIGAAVMMTDAMVKEATGVSFMAQAMKPLTTVMQEAIKLFTELYTRLLIAAGVDEQTAKDIAQIAGMIQGVASTMAAIALVAVVGVQVIGPMVSAVASKLASAIAQAAPVAMEALKQMGSSFSHMFHLMLTQLRGFVTRGADAMTVARFASHLEIAQAATAFGDVVVRDSLQIASANHQKQAAEHLAEVRMRMAISEEITSYLTRLVEDYGASMQDRTRQIEQLFADLKRSQSVSQHIARNV
ncbi:type III secretion system translocon subunit SctE [Pseudomonas sp. KK4]|uniref:type III secretion system translocon subunit SctE n=1 Tax=Pseudomonas sp. KK4 TaxID=1855729 RepID=UPI00097BE498|nr:type III secretion system translocon subunit SctE [Pseudomonas sp. KK4]